MVFMYEESTATQHQQQGGGEKNTSFNDSTRTYIVWLLKISVLSTESVVSACLLHDKPTNLAT